MLCRSCPAPAAWGSPVSAPGPTGSPGPTSPTRAACCSLTGAVHVLLMPCNAAEFHPLISPQLINPATETALRLTALCGVLIPKAGKCQIFCLLLCFQLLSLFHYLFKAPTPPHSSPFAVPRLIMPFMSVPHGLKSI